MIDLVRDRIHSILLPHCCTSCGSRLSSVQNGNSCDECWSNTTVFNGEESICVRCGMPVPNASKTAAVSCWQCDGHHYDKARSVGIYENALGATVVGLKTTPKLFSKVTELLLTAMNRHKFDSASMFIPIPLSKQRKLERGFNQAEVIAEALSNASGIKTDNNSLVRVRHSPIHRVGMDQKARDLSVKNAFEVLRPRLVEGVTVLLVDDVLTTGATASYCAKALKKSGAAAVNVLTLARAVAREPR